MSYGKPQVTIDLDEYNDLLDKSKPKEDEAFLFRTFIAELVVNQFNWDETIRSLRQQGIQFWIKGPGTSEFTIDDIHITKLETR